LNELVDPFGEKALLGYKHSPIWNAGLGVQGGQRFTYVGQSFSLRRPIAMACLSPRQKSQALY
jgi:hypothetical protein